MSIHRIPPLSESLPENLTTKALLCDATAVTEDLIKLVSVCAVDGKVENTILGKNLWSGGQLEETRWHSDLGHTIHTSAKRKKLGGHATTKMTIRVVPSEDTRTNLLEGLEPELINVWKRKNKMRGTIAIEGMKDHLYTLGKAGHKEYQFEMTYSAHSGMESVPMLNQLKLAVRMRDPLHKDRVMFTFDPLVGTEDQNRIDIATREVYRRAIDELRRMLDIEQGIAMNRLLEIACRSSERVATTINESAWN